MQAFNKQEFEGRFDQSINSLQKAEKTTRTELLSLSRSVLEATHATGDIGYVNRILAVLTPVNRKVAIEYFKAFTGFRFDAEAKQFTKKNKKQYEEAQQACADFLEDPLNNIWSWAERNIEIESKEFDQERLNKTVESLLKKADKNGFKPADVLKAMMQHGVTVDTLVDFMGTIEGIELNVQA